MTEEPPRPLSRDTAYQRSLEVHHRIEALYPRIEEYRAYFRTLMPVDHVFPQPPGKRAGVRLDPIVCGLAIKAATTKRAILAVCELGDGDNAIALARVLLENACLLEWLTRGKGRRRLEAYVMFTSVEHERIVATIDRHKHRVLDAGATSELRSDPYHRAIWKYVFGDKKTDRATRDFDGEGKGTPIRVRQIFEEIAAGPYSYDHDVLYGTLGSDNVHSGPFSLSRTQHALGNRPTFVLKPMPVADMCMLALATSNAAMFLVLDTLTEYLGLDLSAEMEPLKARWKEDPDKL